VDFTLQSPAVNGGVPTTFDFQWSSKAFSFSRSDAPTVSYTDQLENLLMTAISTDPDFGNNVEFVVERDSLQRTRIVITGKNALLGQEVQLSLLFATGTHQADSAYYQMGFSQLDYSSSLIVTIPPTFSHQLVSPEITNVTPRKFVDILIDEYPLSNRLVKRIYASSAVAGFSNEVILFGDTRTRMLNRPIPVLKTLTITILLPNSTPSPSTETYDLEVTIYHNVYDIEKKQGYKNQFISL
jgi:hypothetical protein